MEGHVCMFCAVLVRSDLDCKYFKHSCHCPWSPVLHPSPFPPLLTLLLLYPAQYLSLLISPVCSHSWLVEIPRVVPPSCSRNFKHLLLISQSPQQYLRTGFSSPLLPDCSASSGGNVRLARKKLHFWFHALTLFLVCLQETPGVFLCCSSYLGFFCFFTAALYAPSKLPVWSWQEGNCLPAYLLLHYICCSRNIFFCVNFPP